MPELIACPDPACPAPAMIIDRWTWRSTGGPLGHARTRCARGHGSPPPPAVVAQRSARPTLRKGGRGNAPLSRLDAEAADAGSAARDDRDTFCRAPSMDQAVLETIAARLEFRGTDEGYARRSQAYFARLPLADARRILALGCGTGIEVRALRRLTRPEVSIVGLDHSPTLVEAARRLTAEEGLSGNVTFLVGDAHLPDTATGIAASTPPRRTTRAWLREGR